MALARISQSFVIRVGPTPAQIDRKQRLAKTASSIILLDRKVLSQQTLSQVGVVSDNPAGAFLCVRARSIHIHKLPQSGGSSQKRIQCASVDTNSSPDTGFSVPTQDSTDNCESLLRHT